MGAFKKMSFIPDVIQKLFQAIKRPKAKKWGLRGDIAIFC
jgi:hypothetical protein